MSVALCSHCVLALSPPAKLPFAQEMGLEPALVDHPALCFSGRPCVICIGTVE